MEIKDAYKAYQNMYDCILSPSGNYNTWTSDFGDMDSDLADALRDLGTLVNQRNAINLRTKTLSLATLMPRQPAGQQFAGLLSGEANIYMGLFAFWAVNLGLDSFPLLQRKTRYSLSKN